jgi:hypothetical protein
MIDSFELKYKEQDGTLIYLRVYLNHSIIVLLHPDNRISTILEQEEKSRQLFPEEFLMLHA